MKHTAWMEAERARLGPAVMLDRDQIVGPARRELTNILMGPLSPNDTVV